MFNPKKSLSNSMMLLFAAIIVSTGFVVPAGDSSMGTALDMPFRDEFPSSPLPDPIRWINTATYVTSKGANPPSPPYALAINGNPGGPETITSYPFDLTAIQDSSLVLCYSYQPQGNTGPQGQPEPEDSLIVEFRNNLDHWIHVRGHPGEAVFPFRTDTVFVSSVAAGSGATFFHDQFQIRFRSTAEMTQSVLKDVWFVDDVFFGKLEDLPVGIADNLNGNRPDRFRLHQNYPNPFNPSTTIRYDLPKHSKVTVKVYNVLGQEVRTLVDRQQTAGLKTVEWNGKNDAGIPAASGFYLYLIRTREFTEGRKMLLLR